MAVVSDTATILINLAAMAISISALIVSRRGYLRAKANLKALEAQYPHLAKGDKK